MTGRYGGGVRCPYCHQVEDRVVDSRLAEDGGAIRRRRECESCSRRYTTFERLEEIALSVVKRSGGREPFDRAKVVAGITYSAVNRPIDPEAIELVAIAVEEQMRVSGAEVSTEAVGLAVLDRLRQLDDVAYLRFASVYKGFEDASDFARELGALHKTTEPKSRAEHPAGSKFSG